LENKKPFNSEIIKDLSTWGNYIVIPSQSSPKDIYIQFIPDEDFLKVLPQLKIKTYKSRSILMNDTTDLLKKFMWMLWGAS
jgi:homoserine kinase